MRRSQASAIESPAPAAAPSTWATTGFGISCKMRETSMPRRRFAIFASNANGARPSAIDLTSPPTQNVPPAPFSRTARTSWSSAARRAASTRPRVMSGLSALRRSGRFMVMVSSPESSFCRTISLLMRCLPLFACCCRCPSLRATGSPQRAPDDRLREAIPSPSFRSDAKHRTRNLEIPGLVLTHHPGMTSSFLNQRAA